MNAVEQRGRWFVGGVLGDEFAAESAGKERGRELVHLPARLGQPHLKLVGQRKQSLHSPHDFLLLGERREIELGGLHVFLIDAGLIDRVLRVLSQLNQSRKALKIKNRVVRQSTRR